MFTGTLFNLCSWGCPFTGTLFILLLGLSSLDIERVSIRMWKLISMTKVKGHCLGKGSLFLVKGHCLGEKSLFWIKGISCYNIMHSPLPPPQP